MAVNFYYSIYLLTLIQFYKLQTLATSIIFVPSVQCWGKSPWSRSILYTNQKSRFDTVIILHFDVSLCTVLLLIHYLSQAFEELNKVHPICLVAVDWVFSGLLIRNKHSRWSPIWVCMYIDKVMFKQHGLGL